MNKENSKLELIETDGKSESTVPVVRGDNTTVQIHKEYNLTDKNKNACKLTFEKVLGKGSFGVVFKATFQRNNETLDVAVKNIKLPDNNCDNKYELDAGLEVELNNLIMMQNTCKENNIVCYYNYFFDSVTGDNGKCTKYVYIIMEYVKGISLEDYIYNIKKRQGIENYNFDLEKILYITASIVRAIAMLHKNGIVHRDIKPANIMLNLSTYNIKVIDLGLSCTGNEVREQIPPNIEKLSACKVQRVGWGTPIYLAPDDTVGPENDVYSLGITLFELLSGVNPTNYLISYYFTKNKINIFEAKGENNYYNILKRLRDEGKESILSLVSKKSKELDEIINNMVNLNASKRMKCDEAYTKLNTYYKKVIEQKPRYDADSMILKFV